MIIRPIKVEEVHLLEDFLYESIFQLDKDNLLPRDVIHQPELRIYFADFGKKDDYCLVAEVDEKVVGAVWSRILAGTPRGYGNVDDTTPELGISLVEGFRNRGIGRLLMQEMAALLKKAGYAQVSLSVQKKNYAAKMYQKLGFEIVKDLPEEYIMLLKLNEAARPPSSD